MTEMILQVPKQQRAEQAQCGPAAAQCQGPGDNRCGKAEVLGALFAFVKIRLQQSQTSESRGKVWSKED